LCRVNWEDWSESIQSRKHPEHFPRETVGQYRLPQLVMSETERGFVDLSIIIRGPNVDKYIKSRHKITAKRWEFSKTYLRHDATSRKVAGSIPDDVIGFFSCSNHSSRTYGPGVDSASNINEY
jgi:hypothetical protein